MKALPDYARHSHSRCKFWTPKSYELQKKLMREMDACQTHRDAVVLLRAQSCRAVEIDDPEYLAAVLSLADSNTQVSTEIRFATAIAAMSAKKYRCAYAAWDDNGMCWSKDSDDPWLPDSHHAASVLMRVCDEVDDIRDILPKNQRREGDHNELCSMMDRLST